MMSELNKLKKAGTKLDFYTKNPTADISTDSIEISKLANTTLGPQPKSTNRITARSKSNKKNKKHQEEVKKNFIPDYKILKMLSKEDLFQNAWNLVWKSNAKAPMSKIKPNANNYMSKPSTQKSNYSTAIENLVNQAIRWQTMGSTAQANISKKLRAKAKQKKAHSKEKQGNENNVRF